MHRSYIHTIVMWCWSEMALIFSTHTKFNLFKSIPRILHFLRCKNSPSAFGTDFFFNIKCFTAIRIRKPTNKFHVNSNPSIFAIIPFWIEHTHSLEFKKKWLRSNCGTKRNFFPNTVKQQTKIARKMYQKICTSKLELFGHNTKLTDFVLFFVFVFFEYIFSSIFSLVCVCVCVCVFFNYSSLRFLSIPLELLRRSLWST